MKAPALQTALDPHQMLRRAIETKQRELRLPAGEHQPVDTCPALEIGKNTATI